MRKLALTNGRVLLPQGLREGLAVTVAGDRILSVTSEPPEDATVVDLGGGMLLPGLIDTQVNGGGGILFNDKPDVSTVATIAAAHRRFGTTGMLPTLISDDLSVVAAGIKAVDDAIEQGVPGVLGIHVEGPYLNTARRGIHDAGRLRRIDPDAIALLTSARRGRTLVTLAPECASPGDIAALVAAGVIVAAGHSEADYATMARAIDEGMTGVTHLFNAMSPMTSREPGVTGAALESTRLTAGIIVDGYHVHPAVIRTALASKGHERLMLVSDAMALTGTDQDRFLLQGREIFLEDARLVDRNGTLAGAMLTMIEAVRNVMTLAGIDLRRAVAMGARTPASFLGMAERRGVIVPGLAADLILVDNGWEVRRTWINGLEADQDR